jgi:hypothetical protein
MDGVNVAALPTVLDIRVPDIKSIIKEPDKQAIRGR